MIMAGGWGERMRSSGRATPKPLIAVRGVPLLERNLLRLLSSGFRDVVVATPTASPDVGEYVRTRAQRLAGFFRARVELLIETTRLGNIGAAAETTVDDDGLLVVYADNLTGLDLRAIVAHHREAAAPFTSAVHLEPFAIPFGEVQVQGAKIVAYTEKPVHRIPISSGVFVLGPTAVALLPRNQRTEVASLASRLLAAGLPIEAFVHNAPWIDVNDAAAVARAEALIASHPDVFEREATAPDKLVASALVRKPGALMLERRAPDATRYPDSWDLPGIVVDSESMAEASLMAELRDCLRLDVERLGAPCCFDDIDVDTAQVFRHLVFPVELETSHHGPKRDRRFQYLSLDRIDRGAVSPAAVRAAAVHATPTGNASTEPRGRAHSFRWRALDQPTADTLR